jgi:hypothetical protein
VKYFGIKLGLNFALDETQQIIVDLMITNIESIDKQTTPILAKSASSGGGHAELQEKVR